MLVIRKIKNSFSLLMVFALLTPSIVKLEHHHEHFICKAKSEKHFHTLHEKCAVCSFEYSIFISEKIVTDTAKVKISGNSVISFYNSPFPNYSKYSFSLRAPPAFYI